MIGKPQRFTFEVDEDDAGERLDRWLADRLPDHSRSEIKRCVDAGDVLVDGSPAAKAGLALRGGEAITLTLAPEIASLPEPEDIPLTVVFEDDHLLVIDKAAGMVVHPAPGHPGGTLVNAVMHHCPEIRSVGDAQRPGIVHRLDRGTTGLILVAKTPESHRRLGEAMRAREVKRLYHALAWGQRWPSEETIDLPIGRDPRERLRMAVVKGGREAVSHFTVIGQVPPVAHLLVRLETGRTHQIRVHLSNRRHPILGDDLYGGTEKRWLQAMHDTNPRASSAAKRLTRPMLHAASLTFDHPISGETMTFECDLPMDFDEMRALAMGEVPGS